eukprot:1157291-Pelagomonas_calceolata.AAC.3
MYEYSTCDAAAAAAASSKDLRALALHGRIHQGCYEFTRDDTRANDYKGVTTSSEFSKQILSCVKRKDQSQLHNGLN